VTIDDRNATWMGKKKTKLGTKGVLASGRNQVTGGVTPKVNRKKTVWPATLRRGGDIVEHTIQSTPLSSRLKTKGKEAIQKVIGWCDTFFVEAAKEPICPV